MDYISAFWFISFFAFSPTLRTVPWLNVWVIYAYLYTLIVAQFPVYLDEITVPLRLGMENSSNVFLAWLLVFVLFMKSGVTNHMIKRWLKVFGVLALSLSVLSVPFNEPFMSGIVPNKAMNAIMLVTLLPFMVGGKHTKLVVTLVSILVVHSMSSSALLSLLTLFFCYLVQERKIQVKHVVGICVVVAACFILNKGILDGTTRFSSYKFFLNIMTTWNYLFGFGPGSFFPISAFLQKKYAFHMGTGYELYMHSDVLQYLFQFGALGFLPLLYTVGGVFKYAERTSLLALCAFIAGSLFYYPFHFPVHLVILFLLIKMSVNNYSSLKTL